MTDDLADVVDQTIRATIAAIFLGVTVVLFALFQLLETILTFEATVLDSVAIGVYVGVILIAVAVLAALRETYHNARSIRSGLRRL